ncbi:O-antigen ligase family protein [Hyphomicrobium sp. 2TAF46]|uniref:O-antigen ligase family protein n=1 Tax=Hyphomicrobium sp. 2TAF46 TaxID=3233019 RepID=UPI003F9342E1
MILQFLSIILLTATLREFIFSGSLRHFKWPLIFAGALVLVPALQLLPLPPKLWSLLPGRALIAETYALIDRPVPPLPLTMSPSATWLSGLALLPPVAVFLGTLSLGHKQRRHISHVIIAMGIGSVFLGLLQLAEGPNSSLRFYEITNRTEAVGFFANRNHFAALLYATTLFAAAHLVDAIGVAGQTTPRRRLASDIVLPLLTWLTALLLLTAAQLMARSRAGLVLTDLALAAAIALGMTDRRSKASSGGFGRWVVASSAAVIFLLLPLAIYRIFDRFGADPFADARITFARKTASAAYAYLPFGSGLGSFVPVYQLFETTPDLGRTYANHAHNDFLEVWLETGIFGLALMGVFGVWIIRRTASVWKETPQELRCIDTGLARAASVMVLLLLAHSLVEYPLRTTAVMTVASVALAFLFRPAQFHEKRHATCTASPMDGENSLARRRSRTPVSREPWMPDGDWPEAWQRTSSARRDPSLPSEPPDEVATIAADHEHNPVQTAGEAGDN